MACYAPPFFLFLFLFHAACRPTQHHFILYFIFTVTPLEDASYFGTAAQNQFGGLNALRSLFSAAVDGIAGSGIIWFVTDANRNLAPVPIAYPRRRRDPTSFAQGRGSPNRGRAPLSESSSAFSPLSSTPSCCRPGRSSIRTLSMIFIIQMQRRQPKAVDTVETITY